MSMQEGHRIDLKTGDSTMYLKAWNMEDSKQSSKC